MIGFAFWLLLATPAVAAVPPPLVRYQPTTQQFAAPDNNDLSADLPIGSDGFQRMTVPVRLGGSGPFRFLVDTGSDRTAVSRELAGRLGLQQRDRAVMHSATGMSQVRLAHLPVLQAGRRSVRDIHAPMLAAADIGADGILGIDSLRSQRLEFDFAQGKLSIHVAASDDEQPASDIVVRARRLKGRLVITNAEVDGEHVDVVLDTGSSLTVGNAALRRKLERIGGVGTIGPIDLVSVTGVALRGELANVRNLDIGGARIERLGMVFADAHTFGQLGLGRKPAILLGMNALQSFDRVTIDFDRKTVSLVLPRNRRPART